MDGRPTPTMTKRVRTFGPGIRGAASRRTSGLRKIRLSRFHVVACGAAFAVAVAGGAAVTSREENAPKVWLICTGTKLTTGSYGSQEAIEIQPWMLVMDSGAGVLSDYSQEYRTLHRYWNARFGSEVITWATHYTDPSGSMNTSWLLERSTLHLSGTRNFNLGSSSSEDQIDMNCSPTPPQPVQGNRL